RTQLQAELLCPNPAQQAHLHDRCDRGGDRGFLRGPHHRRNRKLPAGPRLLFSDRHSPPRSQALRPVLAASSSARSRRLYYYRSESATFSSFADGRSCGTPALWRSHQHRSRSPKRRRTGHLAFEESSPELGYWITKRLVASGAKFTALFAYNDLAAIGAIRAIREGGLRVPEDVSVVGFDDIEAANYHYPPLTTVRQPLGEMGQIAAKALMQ